eukprot:COSAG01_NODE_56795_length_316_cov_0.714286_1_plen_54_part_10
MASSHHADAGAGAACAEVVIETGATVFGHAKADWPIIDPRLVWPQYGNGGDCFP